MGEYVASFQLLEENVFVIYDDWLTNMMISVHSGFLKELFNFDHTYNRNERYGFLRRIVIKKKSIAAMKDLCILRKILIYVGFVERDFF